MPNDKSNWARQVNETVREKIPQIIEYYVEFYGEKYRERISERLNDTIFVFMDIKPDDRGDGNTQANLRYRESVINMLEEEKIIDAASTYAEMCEDHVIGGAAFVGFRLSNLTKPAAVCFLPRLEEINDGILFHELNHIIVSDVMREDDCVIRRMGLSKIKYFIDLKGNDAYYDDIILDDERESQINLLDEVINEYLSIKVLDIAQNDGFKFGSTERLSAAYSAAFPSLEGFLEKYMESIKLAVLDGKEEKLFGLFSEKNLNILLQKIETMISVDDEYYQFFKEYFEESNTDVRILMEEKDLSKFPPIVEAYVEIARDLRDVAASASQKKERSKKERVDIVKQELSSKAGESDDENAI